MKVDFFVCVSYLERVFLWREEPLVVPPALNEGEAPGLARGVGQGVDHILEWE